MNTEEAVSLLGSRADFYRQIAQWYFAPLSEEQIEALAAQDLRALAEDDQSSYAEGYNDLYRALRLRHTGTRQALAADFTGAFYGVTTAEGKTAQPFESLYRYDGGSLMGQPRGEVYRALKQARLSFIAALEAELCDRAATYLRDGDVAAAARTLSDQRAFFDEHIASWFGDFRDRASAMVTTRFYRGVLKVTDAFFNDEPGMMDELLKYVS